MVQLRMLENQSPIFWMITGVLFVAGVGVIDAAIGYEFSFSLFYLIPVVLVTWFSGRKLGLSISIIAAIVWFTANTAAGQSYSHPIVPYWNTVVRLGFFVVVTLLLPALKALEREKEIARIDSLTGIANRRHLFEVVQTELYRSQRNKKPLTVVYFDLDGFKNVNDQYGHQTGDKLLCAIVDRTKSELRKTDLIARLGGDEFVILLPETGQDAASLTVNKIQSGLSSEMRQHDWPVTFSIGVLIYEDGVITPDDLIRRADDLMYSVKKSGKNGVAYAVYHG
jgi:diguanylate cyclase (GGDEF)-like protein